MKYQSSKAETVSQDICECGCALTSHGWVGAYISGCTNCETCRQYKTVTTSHEIPQRRLSDWLPTDSEYEFGLQYMRPNYDQDFCHGPRFKDVQALQSELELIRKTQDAVGASEIVWKLYHRERGMIASWIGDKYDDVF